jgi:hypothetical protein
MRTAAPSPLAAAPPTAPRRARSAAPPRALARPAPASPSPSPRAVTARSTTATDRERGAGRSAARETAGDRARVVLPRGARDRSYWLPPAAPVLSGSGGGIFFFWQLGEWVAPTARMSCARGFFLLSRSFASPSAPARPPSSGGLGPQPHAL